jgi:hypothetical protein
MLHRGKVCLDMKAFRKPLQDGMACDFWSACRCCMMRISIVGCEIVPWRSTPVERRVSRVRVVKDIFRGASVVDQSGRTWKDWIGGTEAESHVDRGRLFSDELVGKVCRIFQRVI